MERGRITKTAKIKILEKSGNEFYVYAKNLKFSAFKALTVSNTQGREYLQPDQSNNYVNANLYVNFRPKQGWKGEDYGFDWFRIDDGESTEKFEEIVGKYYIGTKKSRQRNGVKGSIFALNDHEKKKNAGVLQGLKEEYNFRILATSKEDCINKFSDDSLANFYFVPWLSIRNQGTAQLRMILKVQETADYLEFEANDNFEFIPNKISNVATGVQDVTIICRQRFAIAQKLKLHSHQLIDGQDVKRIAGMINVFENNRIVKKKVMLYRVQLFTSPRPPVLDRAVLQIKQILGQALVIPEIEIRYLDLSKDRTELNPYLKKDSNSRRVFLLASEGQSNCDEVIVILKQKAKSRFKDFDDSLPVFFFPHFNSYEDDTINYDTMGFYNRVTGCILIFNHRIGDFEVGPTAAHEILHALKLGHTFTNREAPSSTIYTYKMGKTTNIMDYSSHDRCYSLYHWQWKTLHYLNSTIEDDNSIVNPVPSPPDADKEKNLSEGEMDDYPTIANP